MKLLITGGAGFIGSNLILYLLENYPDVEILNIDKLTYASDLSYLEPVKHSDRYRFKKMDIVDRDALRDIIRKWKPSGVFHLAAE
ncbi:MAG: NAD-dependent epimerase/dehydratase family protein, partial [Bacteroidetes bacterium]|nr:NAD-dependent epimerase/dehydratase family protein [Bacteroidota bacterium]